jgi:hypothetical protein
MVLNATFNNISVILWQSVLLVEETGVLDLQLPMQSVPITTDVVSLNLATLPVCDRVCQ